MENPEKIKIEGLKTIHKLCKFGADHNMEGCSFTEIVECMFDELTKAQAVPEGFVLVPINPSEDTIDKLASVICDEFDTTISGSAHCASEAYKAMIEAQEPK